MRIPRVYCPINLVLNTPITLDDNAAHYLGKVLRMGTGRPIVVFNGEGGEYTGIISDVGKKHLQVTLEHFDNTERESPLSIELAVGLSRGERWDLVLQKATELGATRIVPLLTERTEVKLKADRLEKKWLHWRQIIISACEQCQRNRVPELAPLTTLTEYLSGANAEQKLVLHHRDNQGLPSVPSPHSAALLIGPEGGLSDHEITTARDAGFNPLTLGPRVMRTETAPLAAISVLQYQWGDFAS
ncbi:16S rRNA (uracil(1498)-N(3))-methyltransferase [Gilvimarinus polysaccharolyticus]|uniref:16S rRNA (uracil(1498)-N(3))-methyltransferase n=1 Tax=Gilvimarinus polysaccharolyticus TaxID=863921 RepID=UPI000673B8EC|nr:16S rRNA (uracil(1498)-N(3))-methyltransferase [Gilvimarinus polysaccharolyticus]